MACLIYGTRVTMATSLLGTTGRIGSVVRIEGAPSHSARGSASSSRCVLHLHMCQRVPVVCFHTVPLPQLFSQPLVLRLQSWVALVHLVFPVKTLHLAVVSRGSTATWLGVRTWCGSRAGSRTQHEVRLDGMRIDRTTVLQLLALNVVAVALLWSRLDAWLRPNRCSLQSTRAFTLVSDAVVLPAGTRRAAVHVENGIITRVERLSSGDMPRSVTGELVDVGLHAVLSGFVDVHVHMNEPGREEWEGMWTATRAAAAGGITMLVDMPLNSHPTTTTRRLLQEKMRRANGKIYVDVGFWAGLVPNNAHNASELSGMLDEGALGLKAFLSPSGIGDFEASAATDVYQALPILRRYGRPLLVHAELPDELDVATGGSPRSHSTWLASRPRRWEQEAVQLLIRAARDTGGHVHVCHLSDADALATLHEARASGVDVTVETCPHYLTFAAEDVEDGNTLYKCAPPIRERENRDRLWRGLHDGDIDLVASDHSPCPPSWKALDTGDFLQAWGGISGLQLGPTLTWSVARTHSADLSDLSRWWSMRPAQLAGVLDRTGTLEVGKQADVVVLDAHHVHTVRSESLHHRHKLTPYLGRSVHGLVRATYVRGQLVYRHDAQFAAHACGHVVRP